MTFAAEFLDEMPDTAIAQPGYRDGRGTFIPSGDSISMRCRIEGQNRMVRDINGREVVSSVRLILSAVYNLTTNRHVYYLPSRFIPSGALTAVAIRRIADEDGPCFETVDFP